MRFPWIAILFFTTAVFGQDTLDYKLLITSQTGEHIKFKFYSSVTNTKQYGYLKDGKWTYSNADGYLVKEENFKANKAKQHSAKDGYEVFLDPEAGDTVLIRKWNKGQLELQHAFKPAIIAGGPPGEIRPPGPPGVKAVDVTDVAKLAVKGAIGGLVGKIDGNDDIEAAKNA